MLHRLIPIPGGSRDKLPHYSSGSTKRRSDLGEGSRPPIEIGDAQFDPERGTVSRAGVEYRLENRAASTLALLCSRRGQVISHDDIRSVVWGGRVTSSNSIAIVIGSLRKALGDDVQMPRFLETIPKRGYSLRLQEPAQRGEPRRWLVSWRTALVSLAVLALLIVLATMLWRVAPSSIIVEVSPVQNLTGERRYDAVASALTELESARLSASQGTSVFTKGNADRRTLKLRTKLILWDGEPSVSMTAVDSAGRIVWSAMASGPPFYSNVQRKLDGLEAALRHQRPI